MINYLVENGILSISENKIELPYSVSQVIEIENTIIARVEPPDNQIFNRNIYAFSDKGRLIWQIEECPEWKDEDKPYVDLRIENSNLIAYNWVGADFIVNLSNGKVSQAKSGVRPW